MAKIILISDTHGLHDYLNLPEGDVIIHAGDVSMKGTYSEIFSFARWYGNLPFKHKITIAGNHDWDFQTRRSQTEEILEHAGITYLRDSMARLGEFGINVYGSPWQPEFFDWAFNVNRGPDIRKKWDKIPSDTDILVTHGPPAGYGDVVPYRPGPYSKTSIELPDDKPGFIHVGCKDLLDAVDRVKPKVCVFGHIHEGYGVQDHNGTKMINASVCNSKYAPVHPAIEIEL